MRRLLLGRIVSFVIVDFNRRCDVSAIRLYMMRDRVLDTFVGDTVMAMQNDEVVGRFLRDTIKPGNFIHRHPEDFELWCLGYLDYDRKESVSELRSLGTLTAVLAAGNSPIANLED